MSAHEAFGAEWLSLREGFDAASRSTVLADALAAALPANPCLLDLGAGTGSMFRWLAPRIGGAQRWILADADAELQQEGFAAIVDWAAARGWNVGSTDGRSLLVHAPGGVWQIEALRVDLARAPAGLPLARADAVVCSALMDLVSAAWVARLASVLRVPLLACLSVNGQDRFLPAGPDDGLLRLGFARDQRRDKGFGPALGADAPACLRRCFTAAGFDVRRAASEWQIPAPAQAMLHALVTGHAEAAIRALPGHAPRIEAWTRTRLAAIARRRFAMRVGHCDILALPA